MSIGEVVPCIHAGLAVAVKQWLRERFDELSGMMLSRFDCINDCDRIIST